MLKLSSKMGRQAVNILGRMQQQQSRRYVAAGMSTALLNSTTIGSEIGRDLPSNQYESMSSQGPSFSMASTAQELDDSSTSSHSTPNLLPPMSLSGVGEEDDDGG